MIIINKLAHNILKKKWTEQDIQDLVGAYQETYLSYALDERIRLGGLQEGQLQPCLPVPWNQIILTAPLYAGL
jgi:hypothetical protein